MIDLASLTLGLLLGALLVAAPVVLFVNIRASRDLKALESGDRRREIHDSV
jgi:hypothetical protein